LVSLVFSWYKIVVASQVIHEKLCLSLQGSEFATTHLPENCLLWTFWEERIHVGNAKEAQVLNSTQFSFFNSETVSIFMLHSSIPLVPSPIWVYNSFNVWSLMAWQVKTTTTCWYYLSVFNDLLSHSVSVHHVLWWFFNDEMYMFASPFFELWLLFYIMWTRIGILGVFPCKPQ